MVLGIERQKAKTHRVLQEKRPAGEKKRSLEEERSAGLLSGRRFEHKLSWIGQEGEHGSKWRAVGIRAGGYLQRLNVWRQSSVLYEGRAKADRPGWDAPKYRWRAEEGGEWWPRNRRPGEGNKRLERCASRPAHLQQQHQRTRSRLKKC